MVPKAVDLIKDGAEDPTQEVSAYDQAVNVFQPQLRKPQNATESDLLAAVEAMA